MTDDFEEQNEIVGEVDEDTFTEVFPFSGAGSSSSGLLILPYGATVFCSSIGAIALRVADKGGDIEYLRDGESPWVTLGKTGLTRVK